jgi:hypothetical protein
MFMAPFLFLIVSSAAAAAEPRSLRLLRLRCNAHRVTDHPSLLNTSTGGIVKVVLLGTRIMLSSFHRLAFPLTLTLCTMPILAAAQQPAQSIGQLYATDASVKGSVMLAGSGTSVLSGSSIEAGTQAATLKLERGGSLLVCEGTKLSIASSQSGRQMLFSLNSGNLELNYPLGTEADNLLTPDLRLLLPGPGTVHVAVRVAANGDTCVQSLPWNAAAIVISETMGDATYQVKPDQAVIFKGGHLGQASKSNSNCGCPKQTPPVQVVKTAPPPGAPQSQANEAAAAAMLPPPTQPLSPQAQQLASAPPPPEQHLAVDAPFIFHGDNADPDLRQNVVMLRLENTKLIPLEPTVLPPSGKKPKAAPTQTAQKQSSSQNQSHGFLSKVGAFFASIFH